MRATSFRAIALAVVVGAIPTWGAGSPTVPAAERPQRAARPESPARPCASRRQRQFDFWIGEWNVENRQRSPATPGDATLYHTGTATARIHSALDGCAIVEHWEGHLVPERHVLGFSLRTFDPASGRWQVLLNWPAPGAPSFSVIEGSFDSGIGEFVFPRPAGGFARYRFLDTRSDHPRWEGAVSESADGPWSPFWTMRFSRRDPVFESGLHTGPARTTNRCPDERARELDFLIGDWLGRETTVARPDHPGRSVELRTWPILEGCALVESLAMGEGEGRSEELRVRSFVPSEDRWAEYSLDRDVPGLVRWEGGGSGESGVFVRDPGTHPHREGDPVLERVRWEERDDRLIRETSVSVDGGETWRAVSRAELSRR